MVAGRCVLVNDHKPNVAMVGDAGVYFAGRAGIADLVTQLERLIGDPAIVAGYRARALQRARGYSWDAVTEQYEQLPRAVCETRGPGSLPPFLVDREAVAV